MSTSAGGGDGGRGGGWSGGGGGWERVWKYLKMKTKNNKRKEKKKRKKKGCEFLCIRRIGWNSVNRGLSGADGKRQYVLSSADIFIGDYDRWFLFNGYRWERIGRRAGRSR